MKRNCEVCGSKKIDLIYKQKFLLENNYSSTHNIVACQKCGFVFVLNLPSSKKIERFYKSNIKYAYKHNGGSIPDDAKKLHLDSFTLVDSYFKKNSARFNKLTLKVLDIGCANGYLLNIFKENQYKNLLGIDPSPECSVMANKMYGLKVLPMTLSEYETDEKFDLVVFASVMEHLSEFRNNLSKAVLLLKDNGIMFISVPDGDNFGKILHEPFLEFSLEHINYFTRVSLKNLLSNNGLKNIGFNSIKLDSFGGYALNSLWKKTKEKRNIIFDEIGKNKIVNYIEKSLKKLEDVNEKIKYFVDSKEKIIVWGVGSLTSRLLATTDLKKTNIQFFVDSNPNLQRKIINGLPIKSPDSLKNGKTTVLVSTYIYGEEIKKILLEKYNFQGKIILL